MLVLIACEFSGIIRNAFERLGWDAWSIDLLPSEKEGKHLQADIIDVLNGIRFKGFPPLSYFDLLIAHPPCTYLSHAGARWLYPKKGEGINQERYIKGLEAKEFFLKLLNANIPHKAIENPFPSKIYKLPKHTQIIQPFEYGHPIQKKTLLWLDNLPNLKPTKKVKCEWYYDRKGIRHTKLNGWSAKRKSRTFEGIAEAMAKQRTNYFEQNKPEVTQCTLSQNNKKEDGIPPTNKLVGILPKRL